ncbi:Protein of uncharacterised function (DUF3289) [Flavobacterium hibernum]|nr:DUF3289 family protein [Flavobacterium hibernum]STO09814.1 Protein of uncharacterised function (DUF3289) [Flavobacterium hibernum]
MRLRYSESEIIKTTGGDHDIYSEGDIATTAGGKIQESCDGETFFGDPDAIPELKLGQYFKKGYWTNHKDEPITRAVYGQKLRFHIEFDLEHATIGDTFNFGLYDDDRNDYYEDTVKNVDDFINLVLPASGKDYNSEKIGEGGKAVIEFTSTDNLENLVEKCDTDKIFELYFRCSYNGKHGIENVELPTRIVNYLKLGTLVIDRYKMPGLNAKGTDVAEDMCYGTGYEKEKPIYSTEMVQKYKKQYQTFGFDNYTHRLFSNDDNSILYEKIEPEKTQEKTNKQDDLYKTKIDKLYVKMPNDIFVKNGIQLRNKNKKAYYSKEEIEKLGFFMELSMETDLRLWFNLRTLKALLAWGDLSPVLDEMIDKFKRSEGGIYENPVLTQAIKENPKTLEYCQKVEDYMAEQLKTNFDKLEEVEDVDAYFEKIVNNEIRFSNIRGDRGAIGKKFSKPAFSYWDTKNWGIGNLLSGRTLALNDIWATEVYLKQVVFNGDDYVAKYQVILWDHFGLDKPDLEKFYYYENGFRAWFLLQHIHGYKPFITKMTFTKEFKGNLKVGKAEIQAKRDAEEERDNRLRNIGLKKPGEL